MNLHLPRLSLAGFGMIAAAASAQVWEKDPTFAPEIVEETPHSLSASADNAGRFWLHSTDRPFTHINGARYSGLARLTPNGELDPSLPDADRTTYPVVLAHTADGGAWVQWRRHYSGIDFAQPIPTWERLTKLREDGSIDPAVAPIELEEFVAQAVVLRDQSLVIRSLDAFEIDGYSRNQIARFYANGLLDPIYAPPLDPDLRVVRLLPPDATGRVVIWLQQGYGSDRVDVLQRLLNDGSIDPDFEWRAPGLDAQQLLIDGDRVITLTRHSLRAFNLLGKQVFEHDFREDFPGFDILLTHLHPLPNRRFALTIQSLAQGTTQTVKTITIEADLQMSSIWPSPFSEPESASILAVASDGSMLLRGFFDEGAVSSGTWSWAIRSDTNLQLIDLHPARRVAGSVQTLSAADSTGAVTITGNFTHINGHTRDGVARFLADGSLDSHYAPPRVYPLLALRDGGQIALQRVPPANVGQPRSERIVKLTAAGDVEPLEQLPPEVDPDALTWLCEGNSGEWLVAWHDWSTGTSVTHLLWLNRDGSEARRLPTTFSVPGSHPGSADSADFIDLPSVSSQGIIDEGVELDDGSLLIAARYLAQTEDQTGLVFHLNSSGELDASFTIQLPDHFLANQVILDPAGDILLIGRFRNDLTRTEVALRFHANGSLDPTFAPPLDRPFYDLKPLSEQRYQSGAELLNSTGWPEPLLTPTLQPTYLGNATLSSLQALWAVPRDNNSVFDLPLFAPTFPTEYGTLARFTRATTSSLVVPPTERTVVAGEPASFTLGLSTLENASIQWLKDGIPVAGATDPHLEFASASPSDAGAYHAVISYPANGATPTIHETQVAQLSVQPNTTRLTNFSGRSQVSDTDPQVAGFVLRGGTPQELLIRSIGEGLRPYLPTTHALELMGPPDLDLHQTGEMAEPFESYPLTDPDIAVLAASVGAFPVSGDSQDDPFTYGIALNPTLPPSSFTVTARASAQSRGLGLLEIFDPNDTAARLLGNVSLRGYAGTGHNALIGGFVLQGKGPAHVLIRAVGPTLTQFGIDAPLEDPVLTIHRSRNFEVIQNNDWSDSNELYSAGEQVGAFALPLHSRDAAVLLKLPPGAYTAQVKPAAGTTPAEALLEIYLLEPGSVSTN
ncbi:delta-60 repeat domain-containing protein [Actomonas aquatica]|uniref:Delta-60 repeat domain-containing protein n=1 Tax=Actomonas aquatica TaxID=2866162 RepID=A0ABZ1C8F1_9BACT|nr:delta-60 repeat domain-containing protein [Opitutus sp. WL0086]WRQ87548.1 delta-60 repeat domain-containing protein [Opitutus sp. WL0086]